MMQSIWTLAKKDLLLLSRDPMSLFFIAVFPVLLGIAFGLTGQAFGDDPDVAAAAVMLVNEDDQQGAADFVAALDKQPIVDIEIIDDIELGLEAVKKGKVLGLVHIQKGFSESAGDVFAQSPPKVGVALDPSRGPEGQMLRGALMQAMGDLVSVRMAIPGQGEGGALELLKMETIEVAKKNENKVTDRIKSGYDVSFPSAILWGILGCIAGFAISIARERSTGTFYRLGVAPVPRSAILLGKGLACGITGLAVVLALTGFGMILGLRLDSPVLFIIAALCVAFCFSGLMMALATISRSENAVAGAGWALNVSMSLIGGGMIPLAFMPSGMRAVSNFSPVKWGIISLEGAIWRGFSFTEALPGFAVLIGLGLVGYLIGLKRLAAVES